MIKSIVDRLLDIEYSTDPQMRSVQKYNLPHFVDLDLSYYQTWYETLNEESLISENRYCFRNLYTPNDNYNDMEFPQEYMSDILTGKAMAARKVTPFILFRKTNNNTYRAININKISIELKLHNHPFLYVEEREIIPCEDLACLLLPIKTEYMEYGDGSEVYSGLEGVSFSFDKDGALVFPDDTDREVYESIQLLPTTIKLYFGSIAEEDIGIRIKDDELEYGEKIYIESIILFNPFGELVPDTSKYFNEFENNIFIIKSGINITGWKYYAFYYTEADKSVNNIYSIPQYIIDHDTEAKILKTGNYILGDDFDKIIDEVNGLSAEDLRDKLRKNPSLEHYDQFLDEWLAKIYKYKKHLIDDLLDENYMLIKNDTTFYSMTNKLSHYNIDEDGLITIKRKVWRLYDDRTYCGYCDVLLFINGYLEMSVVNYNPEDEKFTIDTDFIDKNKYGEDPLLEIIFISNVREKDIPIVITKNESAYHKFRADRYYQPKDSNFFYTELISLHTLRDMDNKPTLQQALPYTYNKLDDLLYDITFSENWLNLGQHNNTICGTILNDGTNNLLIYTTNNFIFYYDLDELLLKLDNKEDIEKIYQEHDMPAITIPNTNIINGVSYTAKDDTVGSVFVTDNKYKFYIVDNMQLKQYDIQIDEIVDMCNDPLSDKFYMLSTDSDLYTFKANSYNDIEFLKKEPVYLQETNKISFDSYFNEIQLDYGEFTSGLCFDNTLLVFDNAYNYNKATAYIHKFRLNNSNAIVEELYKQELPNIKPGLYKILYYRMDLVYIIGGRSYKNEGFVYSYNHVTKEFNYVSDIPLEVGMEDFNLLLYNNRIYIIGGTSGYLAYNKTYSTIGIFNVFTKKWIVLDMNSTFTNSIMCDDRDKIYLVGGYQGMVKDPKYPKLETYMFEKDKLDNQEYLSNVEPYNIGLNFGIADGIATKSLTDDNLFYIVGNELTTEAEYIFNFNTITGQVSKGYEVPMEFAHSSMVDMTISEYNNVLFIGDRQHGFNYDRILKLHNHNYIESVFIDKYNKLSVVCGNKIYRLVKDNTWAIAVDITDINSISHIKKIATSNDVYIAKLENGLLVSSPDLDRWYTYDDVQFVYYNEGKFYHDIGLKDEYWIDKDMIYYDLNTTKCYIMVGEDNLPLIEYKGIRHMDLVQGLYSSIMVSNKGEFLYNPYDMNLARIYNRNIIIASKNRFTIQMIEIEEDNWEYALLNDDFKYCNDPEHYAVFQNGVLLDKSKYKIILPEYNNPVNSIYIYFGIEVRQGDIYTIVYVPFTTNIVHETDSYPNNGIVTIKNTDVFDRYGIGKNFYWLFTNGRKIPYKYLKDISNNMIQITSSEGIEVYNGLEIMQIADIYNTKEINIDEFNTLMDDLIDKLPNWGYDKYTIDNILSIVDTDISIEEKIVLLRVYADHYAINADIDNDRQSRTAPFELDDTYTNYPILNGEKFE